MKLAKLLPEFSVHAVGAGGGTAGADDAALRSEEAAVNVPAAEAEAGEEHGWTAGTGG